MRKTFSFENQSPESAEQAQIAPDGGDFFLPPDAQPSLTKGGECIHEPSISLVKVVFP